MLRNELQRGKAHIVHILTLKLDHWSRLPWHLCILAHPLEREAQRGAQRIIQMFTAWPVGEVHHRLTLIFCAPGQVRSELEQFASGRPLSLLRCLKVWVCKLRSIIVTERAAERPHSLVNHQTTYKKVGPLSVAMAIHMPEIR